MPNNNESTTKFKVDISELKKGIQDAQRQIRLANAEFKAASSGMDNWSKSADGISAKLKQLDTTLNAQKSVLGSLEQQYSEVAREQGEASKGAQELAIKIANQQAAIGKTEKDIRKYTQSLSDLESGADNAGDDLKELGKNAEDAGKGAEKAEGGFTILKGVLANLATEGIKKCAEALGELTKELITDSSNAYAQFAAQTGTAADAMGEYEKAIKNVYKNNFGESLEDVASKMAKVKEVTGELDASKLQNMTEKAMTLEDTFEMDIVETLRGVNSLMDHFGMTGEEAFDLIASGAQNGLNYTDELGDNVSEYAGKFSEAGFTADEYFQLLKNGADGGAYNLDKVNDAVNEVTTRLADGTIGDAIGSFSQGTQDIFTAWQNGEATQKDVMASIVKDIQNTTNEQDKMNLAAKAFGTMAEDGGTQFIEALTPVGDTFNDVKGKAEELAAVKYDTPQAAISSIGRTLKTDLLGPLVDKLMPYLNDLSSWVTSNLPEFIKNVEGVAIKIKEVIGFISDISPLLAALGTAIAGLAIVGLIQNIGAIGVALKAWAMSTKLVTAAQWLLNVAMSANPIGLIVIAIAALVAAFVALWNKSEAFRNFWIGLWENIKGKAVEVWEQYLKPALTAIGEKFKEIFDKIKSLWDKYLKPVFENIRDLFVDVWTNHLQPALSALGEKFKEIFDKIKGLWETVLKPVFETIVKVVTWLWELELKVILIAMSALFALVWNGIKLVWESVLKPTFEAIGNVFKWLWDNILKPILGFIKETFNTVFGAIKTIWNNVLKPVFDAIGSKFKEVYDNYLRPTIDTIQTAFQTMSDTISSIWNGLWEDIIKPVVNSILGGVEGMANGVVNGLNVVIDALNGLSFEVPDWVPEYGGEEFGFNISKLSQVSLPRLEKGGVLKRGQVGLLEGNGAEAVVPLEQNKKWIAKTAQDMAKALKNENVIAGNSSNVSNYTFNQYNTSPKALSRLDIYRQTKNQLAFAKGV